METNECLKCRGTGLIDVHTILGYSSRPGTEPFTETYWWQQECPECEGTGKVEPKPIIQEIE